MRNVGRGRGDAGRGTWETREADEGWRDEGGPGGFTRAPRRASVVEWSEQLVAVGSYHAVAFAGRAFQACAVEDADGAA